MIGRSEDIRYKLFFRPTDIELSTLWSLDQLNAEKRHRETAKEPPKPDESLINSDDFYNADYFARTRNPYVGEHFSLAGNWYQERAAHFFSTKWQPKGLIVYVEGSRPDLREKGWLGQFIGPNFNKVSASIYLERQAYDALLEFALSNWKSRKQIEMEFLVEPIDDPEVISGGFINCDYRVAYEDKNELS